MKIRLIVVILLSILNAHCGKVTTVVSLFNTSLIGGTFVYKSSTCMTYPNSPTYVFSNTDLKILSLDPFCTGTVLYSTYSINYLNTTSFSSELTSTTSYTGACVAATTPAVNPTWATTDYLLVGNILSIPSSDVCDTKGTLNVDSFERQ